MCVRRTPYAVRRTYSMNMPWLFHVKVLEEFSRVHWFKQSLHDSAIVHNYVLAILVWVTMGKHMCGGKVTGQTIDVLYI